MSPKTYHTCEPSNKHSIGLLCYGCKWSIYAYWFFKYLSDNNKCDSLLIVTYGALIGVISFFRNELKRLTGNYSITNIRKLRAVFGTYLLLGLEFLIASDILKTVLEPTLNELAILGGIVVLRTVLSVFLNKEIKELETENKDTE